MTRMLAAATLAAAALASAVARPGAQATEPMAFEVASVKPNKSGPAAGQFLRGQPGGVVQVGNMTLRDLITWAYQIQGFQLVGGPEWLPNDRFDITASAGRDLPATGFGAVAPAMLMMRALLVERFGLGVHGETRELPIYALVIARADGRLGPGLRRSATDCAALIKAGASGTQPVPPPPGPDGRPRCGLTGRSGAIMAGGYPLSQFTRFLAPQVQRVVVDRTGLTGDWDIDLAFTPPQAAGSTDPAASDPNSTSLFTALQEQLGLKLEPARGPVEVLVIDRVERPSPD
jgi:uncharacterized protein (TIGR03435 family)